MDIKELAEYARSFFGAKEAPEPRGTFYVAEERIPTWIYDMIYAIHDNGDWLPDDYKYEFIVDSLDSLAEGADPEDPQLEADVYTSDLLKWFTSHGKRPGLVDEAVEQMGHSPQGILEDIGLGQWYEKDQVFNQIVQALRKRIEEIESGIEEEFRGQGSVKDWRPR